MLRIFITVLGLLLAVSTALPATAQTADAEAALPQVRELIRLLEDPEVKAWLKAQGVAVTSAEPAPAEAAASPSGYVARRIGALHQHFDNLVRTWPELPGQFAMAAATLGGELQGGRLWHALILVGLSVGLGLLAERLLHSSALGLMPWMQSQSQTATRVKAAGLRLAAAIVQLMAFAVGSFLIFALVDLPPLMQEILAGYLIVFVLARAALLLCRFLAAPDDEPLRLVPMSSAAAHHWSRRIAILVGWFAFGWVTAALLMRLGFTDPGRQLVAYALGLVLLALWLEAVWRRPGDSNLPSRSHRVSNLLLSAYGALLWLLWAVGAMPAFWLAVFAFGLPTALRIAGQAAAHLTEPAANAGPETQAATAYRVLAERGLRAALIIGAVLLLANAWHFDLTSLTANDTLGTRLLRGIVSAIILFLAADIAWRIIRALIDYTIKEGSGEGLPAAAKRSRLKTLLPILRNVLFVVLFTMAGLMVLSSMGIEIGPLLAGAGVAGVAIGFGAQTLVKDVISGIFYLLDDAFRVGEYIQSGSYKGTVEAFSLRSVKLRHHRGPLYTVPFGELGAVQNMSRDWVIDKMMVTITYDSDLAKAKKLIKQIGKDLAADPDFKPHILEPLKMQGVEQFGDYGIQIRMKMMTKPNEQFTIRRRALAEIKTAFDANGIGFASPTVRVAEGAGVAAAAQQAVALAKPDAPPA
ncbi:mechanosensitive ion channel family protein [Dongia sp.]|uniref:mechanosensitive ion channel family protein n=1 Tax=Dongia sp. TaxID=1977262 RepID=UPI003751AD18